MLSPFGPALQFGGGSSVISANSFWILLADVDKALEPKALEPPPLVFLSLSEAVAAVEELLEDMFETKHTADQVKFF